MGVLIALLVLLAILGLSALFLIAERMKDTTDVLKAIRYELHVANNGEVQDGRHRHNGN